MLPKFKCEDIKKWNACYDPTKWRPADFIWDAIIMLNLTEVPEFDRLWVVLRPEVIPSNIITQFKAWASVQAKQLYQTKKSQLPLHFPTDLDFRIENGWGGTEEYDQVWEHVAPGERVKKLLELLKDA